MADKRPLDQPQHVDASPPKRSTRSQSMPRTAGTIQRAISATLSTGKKVSTKKPKPVTLSGNGPSAASGAVRKGTVMQQPIESIDTSTNKSTSSNEQEQPTTVSIQQQPTAVVLVQQSTPTELQQPPMEVVVQPQPTVASEPMQNIGAAGGEENSTASNASKGIMTQVISGNTLASNRPPLAEFNMNTLSGNEQQPNADQYSWASAVRQPPFQFYGNTSERVPSAPSYTPYPTPPPPPQQSAMPTVGSQSPTTAMAQQMSQLNVGGLDRDDEQALGRIYTQFITQCTPYRAGMQRLREHAKKPDLRVEAAQTQAEMLDQYHQRIANKAHIVENSDILTPQLECAFNEYMLSVDEEYMEIKSEILTQLNRLKGQARPTVGSDIGNHNPLSDLALKRIQVERFAGDYRKWPNFKSKFEQFFHNNTQIGEATKFYRLDEHIERDTEPYQLIAGFDRVEANYALAWGQLCATYDNKRKLVDEMISSFVDLPPMPSATRGNLMVIINATNHLTKSLVRYDEVKVQHWDPIIVNILMRKLDRETQAKWSHERPQREVARLQPLMQFLENRAESMEGGVTVVSAQPTSRPAEPRQQEQRHVQQGDDSRGAVGGEPYRGRPRVVKCLLCGGEHQLFNCNTFRKLPFDQRWKRVRQYKVCENCLKSKCAADRCKLGPCKTCNHKHNGLLCGKLNAPTVANATAATAATAPN